MNVIGNLRNGLVKGLFLAALMALTGSAFASSKGSMELLHPTSIGGTQLPAGTYTVQWDGQGDQVQLQILRGRKAVATTSAHVVKLEHPVRDNSIVVVPNGNSTSVSRINFGKKDFALDLDTEGTGAAGAGSGASK